MPKHDWSESGRKTVAAVALILGGCGPTVTVSNDTDAGDGTTTDVATEGVTDGASEMESAAADTTGGSATPGTSTGSAPTGTGEGQGSTGPTSPGSVLGDWVCTGEGIPLFMRLETVEGSDLTGSICGPSDQRGPPPGWDVCDDIANHLPIGGTFQVLATLDFPGGAYEVEFGFNYIADTDSLEGSLFPAAPPFEPTPASCARYSE
ncbi:MAG: hypothetical protein AAF721_23895 [Myxococcota bacterium]